jgi:hypothetical protein
MTDIRTSIDRLDNILGDAQFADRGLDTDAVSEGIMTLLGYDEDRIRSVFDADPPVFETLVEMHGEQVVVGYLREAIANLRHTAPTFG